MKSIALICFGLAIGIPCVSSIHVAPASAASPGEWMTLGVGGGAVRGETQHQAFDRFAILLSGNFQWGSSLMSIRHTQLGISSTAGDVAVLYARALTGGDLLLTAGLGTGLLYRNHGALTDGYPNEGLGKTGLAWALEAVTGSSTTSGIGLATFGEIAGVRSFGALAVVIRLGKWGATP
jgi:hypothetical protein